jgi:hypothetical protein
MNGSSVANSQYSCDNACFSFTAKNQSVPFVVLKDPYVYKYACITNGPNYSACTNPPGYGMNQLPPYMAIKQRKPYKIEGFDFSMNTNDYTPSNCMYMVNGNLICYNNTNISKS